MLETPDPQPLNLEPLQHQDRSMTTPDSFPHSRPTLGEEEARAAAAVVASGHVAEGPQVAAFERELCAHSWAWPHAVAVSSGTAALHAGAGGHGDRPGRRGDHPELRLLGAAQRGGLHRRGAGAGRHRRRRR
ncbi:MAG: DegT/DnrJ/EryC1/StrS family aminotransferase [Desulfobacterales bacterium]|nr:DegT/DnrJ/EryC1/StrS family aminotransferase [Desulfobacterales bacterium]